MTHKLLLADDSITIQRVVELTFADQGVEVLAVGDGEQAIARIPVDQPDIVLADIGMPKRSGYDVAAFVKGHPDFRHIPVLLLAGAFEPVDEKRAAEVGCNGVLVKPFEPQHVISRVRELLGGAVGAPMQAIQDVGRPVDRLASPRPVEVPPQDDSPQPDEGDVLADFPIALDADLGALPEAPDYPTSSEFAAPPSADLEPAPVPDFNEGESLDDYFARLGAALEAPAPPPAAPSPAPEPFSSIPAEEEVPTLDHIFGASYERPPAAAIDLPLHETPIADPVPPLVEAPPIEPPETPATLAPQTSEPVHVPPAETFVADAFTALLAVEEGEPGATPLTLPSAGAYQAPVITDADVDRIAQRVIERLARDSARDLVADVVSDVAERLVREEIARIRNK